MGKLINGNPWIWVIVQDPGGNEQFLAQHDPDNEIKFIPFFLEKDQAIECLPYFARNEGHTYEAQAIQYKELVNHSAEANTLLFILNGTGRVLEKIKP